MDFSIVEDNSAEFLDALKKAKEAALTEMGLRAERHAKEKFTSYSKPPIDTGRLRASVSFATKTSKGEGTGRDPAKTSDYSPMATPDEDFMVLGTNVEYAPYIELGTSKMDARPFLEPAIMEHLDEYKEIIEKNMKNVKDG